jgi:hypothetical protein
MTEQGINVTDNMFTVNTSGAITAYNFNAVGADYELQLFNPTGLYYGVYTWPTGQVADLSPVVFTSILPTPVPAAFPLFVGGLSMIGILSWRRKRRDDAPVKF